MALFFKHMAVRLWTALFIASLVAMTVLPPFAAAVGPGWMVVPGIVLFVLVFWLTGVIFAAMGRGRLDRLMSEAAIWERAGMDREARQVLVRAEATVDSFFFSPFSRRAPAGRLLAHTARFQLASGAPKSASEAVVSAYLQHFPRDRAAAAKWLEGLLAGRAVTHQTHEIAVRIGAAHPEDIALQRMLAQFYLSERRCDFAALNTYRVVMDTGDPLPDRMINGLADLFLAERRVDTLALQVYLDVHRRGSRDAHLLAGLAACCRMIHPTPLTLPFLEQAEAVFDGVDPAQRREMAIDFLPEMAEGGEPRTSRRHRRPFAFLGLVYRTATRSARAGGVGLARLARWGATAVLWLLRGLRMALFSKPTKWVALGGFAIAVGGLVVNTVMHLGPDTKPVAPVDEPAPAPVVVPVTDPFTLQTAAYLKVSDARRFVNQLKEHGLDAYWTRATGGNKTWYQVRVSHFKTKAQARAYGEDLKKRHIIGDYYVANYKRPDGP
ncbi:hypothetical protein DSCO28_64840 [Desulfosarcina ovata subsp. sediminis]|uniref:SPOR domain-containing protein n=1 Tax=Desulfosarcina ovata subsp. sediminis TaxID=885957 RepID=A0A5K8A0F1_9BACT|nr:SPOR domain-containing protein [Desulfosarcina ovata]BBO85918.1 hypothetical protein DSCO28_64840 [Desulfosarcina ovata subsp. sediminis]